MVHDHFTCIMIIALLVGITLILFSFLSGLLLFILIIRKMRK